MIVLVSQHLELRDTKYGKGVFTKVDIPTNTFILSFKGEFFHDKDIGEDASDHYLQIEDDLYLGPSGELDDYINHSCDPNCFLLFWRDLGLITRRAIPAGTEVTFDYSTTVDSDWTMECRCDSANCRGTIGSFKDLPENIREAYLDSNMVLPYLEAKHR